MKQPDTTTFFLDRSLGKHLVANALLSANISVEVHDSHFPTDAKDEHWLPEVARRGWIVLTKDRRFHNRVLEISAIANSKAKVFKLTVGNLQGREMAEIFVKASQKISRVASSNSAPFIATVNRSGRVKMFLTSAKLRKYR